MASRIKAFLVFLFFFFDSLCSGSLVTFAKGKKRAIVYVPPLMSSSLCDNADGGETVWLNDDILSLVRLLRNYEQLSYDENGFPNNPDVAASLKYGNSNGKEVKDIRKYGVRNNDKKIIDMLSSTFGPATSYGYDIIRYNYDWRKSFWDTSEGLLSLFDEYESICFVGFSLGCLVTSSALAKLSNNKDMLSKVKCCIFIAGPFNGSLEPWYVFENGIRTGSRFLDFFAWLLGVKEMTKNLTRNYPSLYELLPNRAYFDAKASETSKLGSDEGYEVANNFSTMVQSIKNSEWYKKENGEEKDFVDRARVVRKKLMDGVKKYLLSERCFYICGHDVDTAYRLGRSKGNELVIFSTTSGDGTVPFFSSRPAGVRQTNVIPVSGIKHSEMVNNDVVLKKVLCLLKAFAAV